MEPLSEPAGSRRSDEAGVEKSRLGAARTSARATWAYSHRQYIRCGYNESMTDARPLPDSLLPLPPATFHILLAVAEEDRHGYAIIQDVAARTNGELKLSAGTLYRSIQRMLEQGLIVETQDRPAPELDDERRRYYRITPFGATVARAEARRLTQLVRMARDRGFVAGRA